MRPTKDLVNRWNDSIMSTLVDRDMNASDIQNTIDKPKPKSVNTIKRLINPLVIEGYVTFRYAGTKRKKDTKIYHLTAKGRAFFLNSPNEKFEKKEPALMKEYHIKKNTIEEKCFLTAYESIFVRPAKQQPGIENRRYVSLIQLFLDRLRRETFPKSQPQIKNQDLKSHDTFENFEYITMRPNHFIKLQSKNMRIKWKGTVLQRHRLKGEKRIFSISRKLTLKDDINIAISILNDELERITNQVKILKDYQKKILI